jgi:hypothetical protein
VADLPMLDDRHSDAQPRWLPDRRIAEFARAISGATFGWRRSPTGLSD